MHFSTTFALGLTLATGLCSPMPAPNAAARPDPSAIAEAAAAAAAEAVAEAAAEAVTTSLTGRAPAPAPELLTVRTVPTDPSCDANCQVDAWLFSETIDSFVAERELKTAQPNTTWAGIDWVNPSDGCSVPDELTELF